MTGKYDSLRDEVVHRATLDGTCETYGSVDEPGGHISKLVDFYGYDYIIIEDEQGFVSVERFDDIAISGEIGEGYHSPVEQRWTELTTNPYMEQLERRVGKEAGKPWPAYAWPGGYPIAYVMADGESLCSTCMDTEDIMFGTEDCDQADASWTVIGAMAFGADADYPEVTESCAHCNKVICEPLDDAS